MSTNDGRGGRDAKSSSTGNPHQQTHNDSSDVVNSAGTNQEGNTSTSSNSSAPLLQPRESNESITAGSTNQDSEARQQRTVAAITGPTTSSETQSPPSFQADQTVPIIAVVDFRQDKPLTCHRGGRRRSQSYCPPLKSEKHPDVIIKELMAQTALSQGTGNDDDEEEEHWQRMRQQRQ